MCCASVAASWGWMFSYYHVWHTYKIFTLLYINIYNECLCVILNGMIGSCLNELNKWKNYRVCENLNVLFIMFT